MALVLWELHYIPLHRKVLSPETKMGRGSRENRERGTTMHKILWWAAPPHMVQGHLE